MSNVKMEIVLAAKDVTARSFDSVNKRLSGLKSSIFSLNAAIAGIAVGVGLYKLTEAFEKASSLAAEEQKQILMLNAVMKSMGRDVGDFTKQMIDLADAQELATGYGNEQIMSAEHMLATFNTISNQAMPAVLKTTEDLARGWGIDLTQAARILGVASMGMVGQLSRYGITLSDQAKKTKDFKLILKEIQEQVSGSAEAYRYSTQGIKDTFYSLLDDSRKIFGRLLNSVLDPFFEAGTQLINEFNENFKGIDDNQKFIKKIQDTLLDAVKNSIHAFSYFYNAGIDVVQILDGIAFSARAAALPLNALAGVFSEAAKKRLQENINEMHKLEKSIKNLQKDKIDTTGFDDFLVHVKNEVLNADKKIAAEHAKFSKKSLPKITGSELPGSSNSVTEQQLKKMRAKTQKKYVDSWELAYHDKDAVQARSIQASIDLEQQAVDEAVANAGTYKDSWIAADKERVAANQRAMDELVQHDIEKMQEINNFTTHAFSSMEDAWVEFCTTGKVTFSDFAKSVVADIARIEFEKNITDKYQPIANNWISKGLGYFFGATGASSSSASSSDSIHIGAGGTTAFHMHTGGIAGADTPQNASFMSTAMMAAAPRLHTGLLPGEFPAILKKGEGVFTKKQMAALGQQNTAPAVQVNVINNTGTDADVKKQKPKWDGEKWVIGVVLDAMNRNKGGFRTNLKSAMVK